MKLNEIEQDLLFKVLDYIQESESIDFEHQCQENGVAPQDLIYSDEHEISNHIFFIASKLRYLITKE